MFVTRRPWLLLLALLIAPALSDRALDHPSVQARLLPNLRFSASLHIGNVHTTGHGYKLLDQRFYSSDSLDSMTMPEAKRFVFRAFYAFVAVPHPWQLSSRSELMFLPQQLVWYLLILLAAVGVVEGFKSDLLMTWLFLGVVCAGAAGIALNEGNIGTLVRHRDAIFPFIACLSSVGLAFLLSRALHFAASRSVLADPVVAARPGFVRRTIDSSVVASALKRIAARSVICRALTAIFRPIGGFRPPRGRAGEGSADRELKLLAHGSLLMAVARSPLEEVASAWRCGAVGSAVESFRSLEGWQRLRFLGGTLLVASLATAAFAPFGHVAWPMLLPWAVLLVCSLGLITLARTLSLAWQTHRGWASRA